jgi:hypothetical protein
MGQSIRAVDDRLLRTIPSTPLGNRAEAALIG